MMPNNNISSARKNRLRIINLHSTDIIKANNIMYILIYLLSYTNI